MYRKKELRKDKNFKRDRERETRERETGRGKVT